MRCAETEMKLKLVRQRRIYFIRSLPSNLFSRFENYTHFSGDCRCARHSSKIRTFHSDCIASAAAASQCQEQQNEMIRKVDPCFHRMTKYNMRMANVIFIFSRCELNISFWHTKSAHRIAAS